MDQFLGYVEVSDWLIASAVFFSLGFCLVLESLIPLSEDEYLKFRHFGVNTVFLFSTLIVSAPLLALHGLVFIWQAESEIGLLHLFELPTWMSLLLSILVLDLIGQYGVHFLLHRVKWLWRLHMVHHSDCHVEATTGFRHHPGDAICRNFATLFAVLVMGIPLSHYLIYRLISIFFAYLTHANFRLPRTLDLVLSYLFITPNLHKFHHHCERPWTDRNFGNIFSIWDRLFGTLVRGELVAISYGLDILKEGRDDDLAYQFFLPFDSSIKTDNRKSLFY